MGYAAATWFERGEKLTGDSLKRLTKAVTDTVLDSLRNFGKKRPDRATLQERIRETLEQSADIVERGAKSEE